ncbi:MAG TPA: alpha/beta hydrolase [Caulobacteraceae bacterium]|jgi:acetyl esterase/lipase|nr:alpha/beta hydrolase [Caulobacteraceae bacterium]
MPLDRRAQRLLDMMAATGGGADANPSVADRRAGLAALAEAADDASTQVAVEDREIPGPAGALPIRLYAPLDPAPGLSPCLVFFHGGGWVAGSLDTHDGLCRRLCEAAGCHVVSLDYRLAPEHPFPAALMDCLLAVNWVANHAASLGIDRTRLGVGGDSAGGGLAAAVCQIARDAGGPSIALQALICPILDVGRQTGSRQAFGEGHFITQPAFQRDLSDYLPAGAALDDPRISPLHAAGLRGLPPALVHTAEFDPFRDEGEAYAEVLKAAGVDVVGGRHPGMIHYFYVLARAIPYAETAAAQIGAQLRAMFEDHPAEEIPASFAD